MEKKGDNYFLIVCNCDMIRKYQYIIEKRKLYEHYLYTV